MKNFSPSITVYITNHNYGMYLEQSIESVLNQSFQDFELIIIDDGSQDKSRQIIKKYEKHQKISVIFQKNRGLTVSNNIALGLARGEFIVRLDADDYFSKDALKLMFREFDQKELGMVFADWYLIDEKGEVLGVEQRHDFQKDVTLHDQPAHGACTMFRVSSLKKLGGYDESISRQDGYELWLRFIENYEVRNINVPLFYYRQHPKSLTKDEVKLLNTRSNILEKHARKKNESKKVKVLGIIAVRGSDIDSRSQPFARVGGDYLIDRTISVIESCQNIEKIVVTTPDKKILDYIHKKYDKKLIVGLERPLRLARINTPGGDTIHHVLEQIASYEEFNYFFSSTIETPFKRKELIESGINIASIYNVDTVIGVRKENKTYFRHDGSGLVPVDNNPEFLRLEGNQIYTRVSGYLLRNLRSFITTKKTLGNIIGHVIFDKEATFEIKSPMDLKTANFISKNM